MNDAATRPPPPPFTAEAAGACPMESRSRLPTNRRRCEPRFKIIRRYCD